jgi:hypothetical protein
MPEHSAGFQDDLLVAIVAIRRGSLLMIILANDGIAHGKSTVWQRAPLVLGPILGRLAACDLAALLMDSFLTHSFDVVVIAGPYFTREEIRAYLNWLLSKQPIFFFTLRISVEEMKRRIVLCGDAEKTEEWIEADALSPDGILRNIGQKIGQGLGRLAEPLP